MITTCKKLSTKFLSVFRSTCRHGIYRLLMYLLSFDKKFIFELVTCVNTRDCTVYKFLEHSFSLQDDVMYGCPQANRSTRISRKKSHFDSNPICLSPFSCTQFALFLLNLDFFFQIGSTHASTGGPPLVRFLLKSTAQEIV